MTHQSNHFGQQISEILSVIRVDSHQLFLSLLVRVGGLLLAGAVDKEPRSIVGTYVYQEMSQQPNPQQLAESFVKHFYGTFAADRSKLGNLYVSISFCVSVRCSLTRNVCTSPLLSFSLFGFQQDASKLTFEGGMFQGAQNIVGKFVVAEPVSCGLSYDGLMVFVVAAALWFAQSLPFARCAHAPKTIDAQPSGCGGVLVFVTGDMQVRTQKSARCLFAPRPI